MRERLYDGTVGTALFLAAFAKCGGGREYEDAAIGALAPLLDRKSLRNTVRTLKYPGLGIGGGIGSAIYGLVKIAGILDKVDLLDAAEHIADLIDDDDILNARHINLMQGTAGYMTACLSLQAVRPNSRRLRAIDLCGAHLLKRADCDPNSRRSWRDPAGTTRMGLAYGNSGIGLALARAGRILDRPAFAAAAQQAIAFAQGLQAETIAASHACGSGDQPESLCSWCDGAAGIALACLELTNPVSDEGANWSDDLAAQTGILMNGPVDMHLDHVCCGNLGRAASLRRLGIQFGKAEITNLAETIYSRAIRRAKQRGGFELGWGPGLSVPSFHQGSAGIGYELLRLSADPTLPDILSFN